MAAVVREEAWDEVEDEVVEVVICHLFHRQSAFHRVLIKVNDNELDDSCLKERMSIKFLSKKVTLLTSHEAGFLGSKFVSLCKGRVNKK